MTNSCSAPAGSSAAEWVQRGEALLAKRPAQARACFSDASLADPLAYEPAARLGLAQLEAAQVPLATAAATLRRAAQLALREGNRSAAAAAHRAVGEAHARQQDWAAAAGTFDEAFRLAPTDCVLSAHLAQARSVMGQHDRAVAALRAALAEDHACLTAHQWLARVLPSAGDLGRALQHARAALELNPYEEESKELLRTLLAMPGAAEAEERAAFGGGGGGGGAAKGGRRPAEAEVAPSCGATWMPPRAPEALALPEGCPEPGSGAEPEALLLANPFEEGCFHDDVAEGRRHEYYSCGQFNNVLASLLHSLALSRLLCRTLLLPGFFIRFGARLTRVSNFRERWLPTSHFFNRSRLAASFHVRDLDEWLRAQRRLRGGRRKLEQPLLLVRGEGGRAAQRRFFEHHNLSFAREEAPRARRALAPRSHRSHLAHPAPLGMQQPRAPLWRLVYAVQVATFPHFMQQQSEMRWVRDDDARHGYFTRWDAALGARFWRSSFEASEHAAQPLLAFDAPPSVGFGMDRLRWDAALRWTRGHLAYVDRARAEAAAVARELFGGAPYLAVHIRRGADRLHDFCHTAWGQRCFGWNISLRMCYPTTEVVAARIAAAQARWGVRHVFLATDSPRPELFEDVLASHGVEFRRYGQSVAAALPEEFALPVDQLVCAQAPYFLGNVPSTVTATIVQERDNAGHARETTDFFGFEPDELAEFRGGWVPSADFSC